MRVGAIWLVLVGCCAVAANAAEPTDVLIKSLSTGAPAARLDAAEELANEGPRAKAAVPALVQALAAFGLPQVDTEPVPLA